MLDFVSASENAGGNSLSRSEKVRRQGAISRRQFVQYCEGIPLFFLSPSLTLPFFTSAIPQGKSVAADGFVAEKYHDQVSAVLAEWGAQILESPQATTALEKVLATGFTANSPKTVQSLPLRRNASLQVWREQFAQATTTGGVAFLNEWRSSLSHLSKIITAEFQVTHIRPGSLVPSATAQSVVLETRVRYELVGTGVDLHREQRVGNCELIWELLPSNELRLQKCKLLEQTRSRAAAPVFHDIADHAFGANRSYAS